MESRHPKRRMIPKLNKFPASGKPSRYFRDALFASLVYLKPKLCLEIGTHIGQSTLVFQKYFDEYQRDGIVITVDIKNYAHIVDRSIKQLIVHPHVSNSSDWHYVNDEELLDHDVDSVALNTKIIQDAVDGAKFDFCFLDGDHQRESVINDFAISRNVLGDDQYILLDDTEEAGHDSKTVYGEIVAANTHNIYSFSKEWGVYCGCALIWNKKTPPTQ